MLTHLDPASAVAVGLLIFALPMVVIFEATNGFHDAANAVATVIYTKSLVRKYQPATTRLASQRLGNIHMTPVQDAAAEIVSAVLIGTAGFTGLLLANPQL
jgi:phosphate/sulfate permease